jgi:cytoskeletal protein CcmA (bactofilin family)
MLGNKNTKPTGHYDTLISGKSEIRGDIRFSGGLHVDGIIKGNLIAEDESGAILRISETGHVEGEIRVPNVIINGEVVGNVFASKHIELAKNANVTGDVHYMMMEMVMGAQVNGNLVHQGESNRRQGKKDNNRDAVITIPEVKVD